MAKKRTRVHPLVAAATALPLAIAALTPKSPAPPPASASFAGHPKVPVCAVNLSACPVIGCEAEGTPHALVNQTKRQIPSSVHAKVLTWEDFTTLQEDADSTVGQDQE